MNASIRRNLSLIMVVILLLAACVPTPAATQDPTLMQQQVDQSVTATVEALNSQTNDEQSIKQSVDATITALVTEMAGQNASEATQAPTETDASAALPTLTPEPNPCDTIPSGPDAPTITSISPSGGFMAGGSVVTITGKNFIVGQGHTHFCFGMHEATAVNCKTTTRCTLVTPFQQSEGNISVTVQAFNDTSQTAVSGTANSFVYVVVDSNAPLIESILPREGSIRGGTKVTVTGKNFHIGKQGIDADVTKFSFGANPATDVVCETDIQCTLTSPPGEEGYVVVKAKNGEHESQHIPGNDYDGFKYNGIPDYGCGVLTITPANLTVFSPQQSFTIKWIIKNTGQKTWPAGLDVKYSAGEKMTTTLSAPIKVALKPNDTFPITIDAIAPKDPGKYYMTWSVEGQGCDAYVAIIVE